MYVRTQFAPAPAGIKASARHILVKRADDVDMLLEKLAAGSSFANLAREYSFCSSGKSGGSLGSFKPGAMVPAFDEVIFNADTPLGEVVGPVATSFGYHLIVVDKRTGI
jgi:peptidyl-prolyl cis-trans isomerase C